ncbi:MAG TPA: alpha/beta hydrolase [Puia sp.]|nr:alpha/beta hydrolase [Puia sp.]
MDLKHYVATTRPVKLVKVSGQPDQYWYEHDENNSADVATSYFRCGQYVDNSGEVEPPFFFNPRNEDVDYIISPGGITPAQLKSNGGSKEMFDMLFNELEQGKKDLLLFMFGYHNPLTKEFDHVHRIHENFIEHGNTNIGRLLMLTWPSQGFGEYNKELGGNHGEPVKNGIDINSDVAVTGKLLAIFLSKLRNYMTNRYATMPAGRYQPKLHFIVQSMANQIWNITLEHLINNNIKSALNGMFEKLMLTSPDIQDNIFQESSAYKQSTDLANNAFVVYSKQDTILQAADVFHHISEHSRLGLIGPQPLSSIPLNTNLLEVTQGHRSFSPIDYNHRYFEYHPAVINFYAQVFNGMTLPKINYVFAR